MSKTSKTLRGSAIVGLSAVAFTAAGATSAFAATTPPATGITITPSTQTGNTSTGADGDSCLGYTAKVTPTPTAPSTINVSITQPLNSTGSVGFCTPPAPLGNNASTNEGETTGTTASGQAVTTDTFDVNADGTVVFGVYDDTAETDTLQAYNDADGNGAFTAGEANGTATATFVNNSGDQSVKSLTLNTTTAKARPGDNVHFVVTALNGNSAVPASQQGVVDAQVNYIVTGPDAQGPTACNNTTGSDGTVYCPVRLTGGATLSGTDNVTFFVNNATNSGPGADAGDTQVSATITNIGAAPAGDTVAAFCDDPTTGNQNGRSCTTTVDNTNPANNPPVQEVFEFDILDPGTNPNFVDSDFPSNHTGDTGADTSITYTLSGASAAATLSNTTDDCVTNDFVENGEGGCSVDVTVNEPNPTVGEKITVTGTLTGTNISDSATLTFNADPATARNITLSPATQNVTTGHTGVLIAKVTDAGGNPVPNVGVDFTSTGQGAFTTGCFLASSCTTEGGSGAFFPGSQPFTGPDGTVQIQVASGTSGVETVSATIDPQNNSQCGDPAGFVNGLPVAGVGAGNCSATATVNYAAAPPVQKVQETPSLKAKAHGHRVTLKAKTHPTLVHATMHFYIVKHGVNHLIASHGTNSNGVAKAHVHLKKGHYKLKARVVHAGSKVVSHFSAKKSLTVK